MHACVAVVAERLKYVYYILLVGILGILWNASYRVWIPIKM